MTIYIDLSTDEKFDEFEKEFTAALAKKPEVFNLDSFMKKHKEKEDAKDD